MTLLVMDHPDLMARFAILEAFSGQNSLPAEQGPRKPHRMRFHFGFDQHRLSQEDQEIIRQHGLYLREHPEIRITLHGHADILGNEVYNGFLSRLRASSVARLLQREGVHQSRIALTGWGCRKPLTRPEDHAANRRLELEYHCAGMSEVIRTLAV
ncbi:OmpA family protein [Marinobacter sp.]|uniref:OmpA family protein n=1 Tax=Marinobacter sp. TaxID=50741 RepID=UPI00384B2F21